ncbi:hypothetical protein CU103_30065 [Phyllobacterium sophorae]|uniref:Uncharacterized protein n=1 Tax=Phyllobacterium sophorae TaxID=1520277 RepID=A0A2P7AQ67_9HYPH|nr:hypothetical protein CU103_30065 [Phyllobacterium sophorae]
MQVLLSAYGHCAHRNISFSNRADIGRLPGLPADVNLDPKDRLTGAQIKSVALRQERRGRMTPDSEPYGRMATADGPSP